MLTNKIQSLWTRTAMMLFLVMTSVVASAQTFVVVDKQGNKITYDVSKVDSVTFQQDPPAVMTLYRDPIHSSYISLPVIREENHE